MKPLFAPRHYKVIGAALKRHMDRYGPVSRVAVQLADDFEKDNPKFDRYKWFAYCGWNHLQYVSEPTRLNAKGE